VPPQCKSRYDTIVSNVYGLVGPETRSKSSLKRVVWSDITIRKVGKQRFLKLKEFKLVRSLTLDCNLHNCFGCPAPQLMSASRYNDCCDRFESIGLLQLKPHTKSSAARSNLTCLLWNANSILHRLDKDAPFRLLLDKTDFDLICINESRLLKPESQYPPIPGYNWFHVPAIKHTRNSTGSGGASIGITHRISPLVTQERIQCLHCLHICFQKFKIGFVCVYI